jgi:hypothetical protein
MASMKKLSMFSGALFIVGVVLVPLISQAQVNISPANPISPCQTVIQANLSYGMADSGLGGLGSVTALQQFLKTNGYLAVQPTGYFGSLTETSVKEFQSENGVPATGYVGPLTRAALGKYSCSGSTGQSGTGQPEAITVISPEAGATLTRGSYQNIIWQQANPSNVAPGTVIASNASTSASTTLSQNMASYDISLVPLPPQCAAGQACPLYMLAPFPIANGVYARGNYQISWPWIVATSTPGGPTIPDGKYTIQVCDSAIFQAASESNPINGDTNCAQSGTFSISN